MWRAALRELVEEEDRCLFLQELLHWQRKKKKGDLLSPPPTPAAPPPQEFVYRRAEVCLAGKEREREENISPRVFKAPFSLLQNLNYCSLRSAGHRHLLRVTHVEPPLELEVLWLGPDLALEVGIRAFLHVVLAQGGGQPQGHTGKVCKGRMGEKELVTSFSSRERQDGVGERDSVEKISSY